MHKNELNTDKCLCILSLAWEPWVNPVLLEPSSRLPLIFWITRILGRYAPLILYILHYYLYILTCKKTFVTWISGDISCHFDINCLNIRMSQSLSLSPVFWSLRNIINSIFSTRSCIHCWDLCSHLYSPTCLHSPEVGTRLKLTYLNDNMKLLCSMIW